MVSLRSDVQGFDCFLIHQKRAGAHVNGHLMLVELVASQREVLIEDDGQLSGFVGGLSNPLNVLDAIQVHLLRLQVLSFFEISIGFFFVALGKLQQLFVALLAGFASADLHKLNQLKAHAATVQATSVSLTPAAVAPWSKTSCPEATSSTTPAPAPLGS